MDFSKYQNTNTESPKPTGLAHFDRPTQTKPDVGALVVMGAIGLGIAASTVSAIPGWVQQSRIEAARAERLQADGLRELSDSETARYLKDALPLVNPLNNELAIITWEQVIKDNNLPPGAYFGQNFLVVKALNGRGDGSSNDRLVSSHAIGNLSPEQSHKRYSEVLNSISR